MITDKELLDLEKKFELTRNVQFILRLWADNLDIIASKENRDSISASAFYGVIEALEEGKITTESEKERRSLYTVLMLCFDSFSGDVRIEKVTKQ